MDIFVFSSKNLTNIWAGIGAKTWAVSDTGDQSTFQSRKTKSKNMKVGSFGILYCNQTHSLTTPFIVYSAPDPDITVSEIWKENWVLPFKIFPLGSPERQLSSDEAKKILPIFQKSGTNNFSKIFYVQAVTVFSPTVIDPEDWEILMSRLAV